MSHSKMPSWAVVVVLALAVLPVPAHAAFVFNIQPDGQGNVVANGSGTLNLSAIERNTLSTGFTYDAVLPAGGDLLVGSTPFTAGSVEGYQAIAYYGNASQVFGTSVLVSNANAGSGSVVGIGIGIYDAIFVPSNYISGAYLSDSAIWDNSTLRNYLKTPTDAGDDTTAGCRRVE